MFVSHDAFETLERWVHKMSDIEIIQQLSMFESILEFDACSDFIFLDEVYKTIEILRDECVRRLELYAYVREIMT